MRSRISVIGTFLFEARRGKVLSMSISGPEDLEGLRRAGAAVAEARDTMARFVAPGVSLLELDAIGRDVLARLGARSAPQLAYGFPGTTCLSVNDAIAHGIPTDRRLSDGDLLNIDVSAELNGYWADTGASFPVGEVSPRLTTLLDATRKALEEALDCARAGRPMSDIARAVQRRAKQHGFRVIKDLCGHGVGRNIHEPPNVPNVIDPADEDIVLHEGLVLTIEPFLTTGATRVREDRDGWTLRTVDKSIGAQFEHTFVVTATAPLILTA